MRRSLKCHGGNIFILGFTFFLRIPFLTKVSFTGLFLVSWSFSLGRIFFVIFVLFLLFRTIRNEMSKFLTPKTRLVLDARNLDISLRIVRKRRKRTKMTKKALPRKKDQDTRNKPVKLTLVKNGILKKKVNPRMKMLLPWHSRPLLIIPLPYLKISLMMRMKIKSYVLWPRM